MPSPNQEFMKRGNQDAPQKGAERLSPERNPEMQAGKRVQDMEKKLKPLATTVAMKDVRPFWPTAREQEQMKIAFDQVIAEAGRTIDPRSAMNALATTVSILTAEPKIREVPSKELLDALQKIGQANRDLAKDNAEQKAKFEELGRMYSEMKAQYEKQQAAPVAPAAPAGTPTVVNNINLGPQGNAQAPAQAVEKKTELMGWRTEAFRYMEQLPYIQTQIDNLLTDFNANKTSEGWNQAAFKKQYDALNSERRQILDTVNKIVNDARNQPEERGVISPKREETDAVMTRWVTDLKLPPGAYRVWKGAYKI